MHALRDAILQAAQALHHCRWQAGEADAALAAASAAAAAAAAAAGPPAAAAAAAAGTGATSAEAIALLHWQAPDDPSLLASEVSHATAAARTTFEALLATWLALAVAHPHLRDPRELVEAFGGIDEVSAACAIESAFGGHVLERLRLLQSPAEMRRAAAAGGERQSMALW